MGGMGFGGSTGATSTVNSPIDSPVSSGDISSRPILAWIFESEEYTALYHEIYAEFMETYFTSGWVTEEIERVSAMIAPYVEADPTAFFTYEQFQTAAETLKEFCSLRAESILGQLDGSIPSTTSGQNADSSALVDASHVDLSDLGEFNQGGMGGRGGSTTGMPDMSVGMPEMPDGFTFPGGGTAENDAEPTVPGAGQAGTTTPETGAAGSMTPPEGFDGELPEGFDPSAMGEMPSGGMGMPGQSGDTAVGDAASAVMQNGQMGSMTPPEGFDPSAMGGMPGGGMGMPGMGGDAAAAQSGMQPVEQQTQSGMTPETDIQPESEGAAKEGAEPKTGAAPEASAQPEISATEGNQTPAEEAEGAQGESAKPSREQGGFSGEFPGMENMNGGASDSSQWIMLAVCAAALVAGIIAAKVCKSGR